MVKRGAKEDERKKNAKEIEREREEDKKGKEGVPIDAHQGQNIGSLQQIGVEQRRRIIFYDNRYLGGVINDSSFSSFLLPFFTFFPRLLYFLFWLSF
jgi:hypothetical protein